MASIRDSKTVNGTTYNYITQNGQVVRQTGGGHTLDFIYDNQGRPMTLVYDGTAYTYMLNLQGDVIALLNSSGGYVAKYVYDAWGKVLSVGGSNTTIANAPPCGTADITLILKVGCIISRAVTMIRWSSGLLMLTVQTCFLRILIV